MRKIKQTDVKIMLYNFEMNNLFFRNNTVYEEQKKILLNLKAVRPAQLNKILVSSKEDPYTRICYGNDYKSFHRNYIDYHDLESKKVFKIYNYIKIGQFNMQSVSKALGLLHSFKKEMPLILDLRSNIGGNIEECYRLLNSFIKDVSLFTLEYNNKKVIYEANSSSCCDFDRIFIWVDKKTISSGEIFTETMKYYLKNVEILGGETSNKRVGQSISIIKNTNIAFINTTFRWYIGQGEKVIDKGNLLKTTDDYYQQMLSM